MHLASCTTQARKLSAYEEAQASNLPVLVLVSDSAMVDCAGICVRQYMDARVRQCIHARVRQYMDARVRQCIYARVRQYMEVSSLSQTGNAAGSLLGVFVRVSIRINVCVHIYGLHACMYVSNQTIQIYIQIIQIIHTYIHACICLRAGQNACMPTYIHG